MKKSKVLLTSAVLAASLVLPGQVKADTAPAPEPKPVEEAVQVPAISLEDQAKRVEEAKIQVDLTKTDIAAVAKDIETLEKLSQTATPENIAQAEAAIVKAEEASKAAAEEVTKAQETVDQAQTAVTKQEEVVKTATEQETAAQTQVDEAQKVVDAAQAKIDGDNSAAKSAVTEAQGKVDTAQTALDQAQKELEAAKQADQKRADNIKAAQEAVQTAQADVDKAQADLTAVQGRVDNSFTNLGDYAKAFINNSKLADFRERDNDPVFLAAADAAYAANNYVSSKEDQARTVEVNNLTPEVRQELNLFALSLVNDIRQAMGFKPALLSQNVMDYVDKTSDIVVEVNREIQHTTYLDRATRQKYGLDNYGFEPSSTSEYAAGRGDANLLKPQKTMTVDALKEWVYNTYKTIYFKPVDIFGEVSFTYAISRSGISELDYRSNIPTYTALDFSSTDYWNNIHIVQVGPKDFNVTEIPYDVKNFVEIKDPNADAGNQATAAEQKLAAARAKLDDAKHALTSAENVREQEANAALTVKTRQRLLDEAKQALATAEAALLASGNVSSADLETLNQAKAKLLEAKEALKTASAEVTAAQSQLQTLLNNLTKAEAALETAQTNQKEAAAKVEKAKATLSRLKEAPNRLAFAQAFLTQLEQALTAKESHYKKELAALEALKILKDKQAADKKVLEAGKDKKPVAGKPVVTTNQASQPKTTAPAKSQPSAASLPKTGEQTGLLSLIGLVTLGLAGLVKRRRP